MVTCRSRAPEGQLGATTTDHITALLAALAAVAVAPGHDPAATVAVSPVAELTRPPPLPVLTSRLVTEPGSDQAVVLLVLSTQWLTTTESGAETATEGVVCDVELPVSGATLAPASWPSAYTSKLTSVLLRAPNPIETVEPPVPDDAARV